MKVNKVLTVLIAVTITICSTRGISVTAANVGDTLRVSSNGNQQEKGNCDGYSYEVWIDNTGGSGSMTLGSGGTFKTEWSASGSRGNFLARRGKMYDTGKKATTYDPIVLNYNADYSAQGGNSRLCVYGWFRNSLVEYYIIEDWMNWNPSMDTSNKHDAKTVTIDGAQYEIFWANHSGPTIESSYGSFKQYFSVRKNTRKSGSITVTDHFKAWANAGWDIGSLYEIALNAEGWESSGSANIKSLTFTDSVVPGTTDTTVSTTPEPEISYIKPTNGGSTVNSDFETNTTLWEGRGTNSIGITSDFAHSGNQSLYVADRQYSWNGFEAESDELVAGHDYSVQAYTAIKSNNFDNAGFTIGLKYDLDGRTNYNDITSASAKSGEWAKLEDEFTIPTGATNISLYVQTTYTENETAADLIPFFLDDVVLIDKTINVTTTTETTTTTTTTETTTTTTETTTTIIQRGLKGDLDCNGIVELKDAVMLAKASAGLEVGLTAKGKKNGDINENNELDSSDLNKILRYLVGLDKIL